MTNCFQEDSLAKYYEQQEEYEKIAKKMVEEGLDPSEPDDYDKYVMNCEDDEPSY